MSTTTQPPKPKRRWYQFSLKTLLIVVTVSCVPLAWIGWRMQRARENRVTLAADQAKVDNFGGTVYRNSTELEDLFDDPGDLDSDLTAYVSRNSQLTEAGLGHLNGLTNLTSLFLNDTQVTDTGLEHLKGLKSLGNLWLDDTKVTDAGLEHLSGLTSLQYLLLNDTNVSDAGLEHLKGLTNLKILHLLRTNVTNEGVNKLQKALPNCLIYHPFL